MASNIHGPNISDVHVNRPLTNMSIAYMNSDDMFVARKVLPPLPVVKRSDSYFLYDKGDFLRDDMVARAPGGVYAESGYGLTTATYTCVDYALSKRVADEERDNSDSPLRPDQDAIGFLTQKALIRVEMAVATLLTTPGNFTNKKDLAAGGNFQWDDYADSTPIQDVWTARKTIRQACLHRPNVFLMASEVFEDGLVDHPDIIDRLKYSQQVDEDAVRKALAGIFGVRVVLEGSAVYNSALPGATDVLADIWGDHALLAHVTNSPSLMTPTLGYTFEWQGGPRVTTKRDELRDSDVHRIKYGFDEVLVAEVCGYLFDNAT